MPEATSDVPVATGETPPAAAAAPPAAPSAPPAVPSWDSLKAHIPSEYKAEKMWESVKDLPTLLKNYAEAQKYVGGSIRIPKEDADQASRDEFYNKLGRPAAPEGYTPDLPDLPSGLSWDEGYLKGALRAAHAAGLSPAQVQAWVNHQAEYARSQVGTRAEQTAAATEELKKAIGPGYEKELAYGQAAVKQLGGDEVMNAIRESGLGNNIGFIKMMIRIGRELGEDNVIDVESIRQGEKSAQDRVDVLMRDKTGPYWNREDPGHQRAVAEVNRLMGVLHPGNVS